MTKTIKETENFTKTEKKKLFQQIQQKKQNIQTAF